MTTGTVVVSLDFELGWGHKETRPAYVSKLREREGLVDERITGLIELLDRFDVPATWATVGTLVTSGSDPLFHAPDLFERVLNAETTHDVGLHSHEHRVYTDLSRAEARTDLECGMAALSEWGITPESFVFPQNELAHLSVLREFDIHTYRRSPNTHWLTSIARGFAPNTYRMSTGPSAPVSIPTSLFLAARRPSRLRRLWARRALSRAISRGEFVHYWLHPHNAITDDALLDDLEVLFSRVADAQRRGEVQVLTMAGLGAESPREPESSSTSDGKPP